jgi:hypothetical protein
MADSERWKKRVLRWGPILGIGALVLAVGCVALAWYTLKYFDGKLIIDFPYINTYLSITSSVAATLIRFAIGGVLAIHWWRKALSAHSVAHLHRRWKVGTSFLEIIKTPGGFGLVAIAITARTLLIAVGAILQRSVSYTQHPNVRLSVTLPERLPHGWAGTLDSGGYFTSKLLDAAYLGFALQKPARINVRGCEGQCQLVVNAPGLAIQDSDCISATISVSRSNLSSWPTMPDKKDEYILFSSNYSSQFVDTPLWLGPALMKPTQPLPLPPKDQETVAFFFTQVNMTADGGSMHSKQCWVRSATSYHNLTVDSQGFVMNGSSVTTPTINSNAPAGDQYRLNKFDSTSIATSFEELNAYLQSRVFFQEEDKAILDAERGSLGSSSIINGSSWDYYLSLDPTHHVVDMLNDVYFRAGAIAGFPASDSGPVDPNLVFEPGQMSPHETTGTRTDPNGTVYSIRMRWYIIASSIQCFAILFAALLYWGWWQLGRHVSFSPIEIAKAFDAPLLQDVKTNSRAKDLLRDVGNLRIRYGAVSQRQPLLGERKQDTTPSTLEGPRDRLVFGLADQTLRPYGGQVFSK